MEQLFPSVAAKKLADCKGGAIRPLPFQVYTRCRYEVELVFRGDDVVYHFFPCKGYVDFPTGSRIFGMLLEDAYLWSLGKSVDAKAEFYSSKDARHFARAEHPDRVLGQPTFYVEFAGVGRRLGAQRVLVDKFLGRLDELLERATVESVSKHPRVLYAEMKSSRWRN